MNQTDIDLIEIAKIAMKERDFLTEFSSDVQNELQKMIHAPTNSSIKDMKDKLWFSIDNDDSRDLDQLTHVEELENDQFLMFVAVADVSSTVKINSAINAHAEHNTTSVYTPAIIFPMLPEKLSTNITSLNPDEERLAFVTEMLIDSEGVLQQYQIYRATVKNHAKLAYNGVGYWLEEGKNPPELVLKNEELQKKLKQHDRAAQKIKDYRQRKGSLSLETIEAKTIIQNRMVIDIVEEKKNRAKDIIENFMILANHAVTKYLFAHDYPAFKRVVRVPKRWDKIVEIASKLGAYLPKEPDSKALEAFLIKQKEKDPVRFPDLSLSVVKLLGRGEYVVEYPGEEPLGHFGLAIKNYSHSTAPNRRFPDLITQRMLASIMTNEKNPYSKQQLNELAEHCTLKEGNADKVARRTQKSAAAVLLSDKLNQMFEGIITGVSKQDTWVRIFTPPVDGKIIKMKTKVDVGDKVTVKLVSVDVQKGFIDFVLDN